MNERPAIVIGSARIGSSAALSAMEIERISLRGADSVKLNSSKAARTSQRGYVAPERVTGWVNVIFISESRVRPALFLISLAFADTLIPLPFPHLFSPCR